MPFLLEFQCSNGESVRNRIQIELFYDFSQFRFYDLYFIFAFANCLPASRRSGSIVERPGSSFQCNFDNFTCTKKPPLTKQIVKIIINYFFLISIVEKLFPTFYSLRALDWKGKARQLSDRFYFPRSRRHKIFQHPRRTILILSITILSRGSARFVKVERERGGRKKWRRRELKSAGMDKRGWRADNHDTSSLEEPSFRVHVSHF